MPPVEYYFSYTYGYILGRLFKKSNSIFTEVAAEVAEGGYYLPNCILAAG